MNELMQSAVFWGGLVLIIAACAVVFDQIFRRMVNWQIPEAARYPHRVANELPRILHRGDHDEVMELKDETELLVK